MGRVMFTDLLRIFVWTWFVCGSVGYRYRNTNSDSKVEENSKKIEEIMVRMDMLTNEVKLLKQDSGGNHDPFSKSPPTLFEPVAVARQVTDVGVEFSVIYKKPMGLTVRANWVQNYGNGFVKVIEDDDETEALGWSETTYVDTSNTTEPTTLFVRLGCDELWYDIQLVSRGQGNEMTNIDFPKFELEPNGGDLSYEIGKNVSFKITTTKNKSKRTRTKFILIKLDQDSDKLQWITNYELVDFIMSTNKKKEYFDYEEETFVVNTAQHKTSGVFMVTSEYFPDKPHGYESGSGDAFHYYVQVGRIGFLLHPSSQPGPFPDGFVEFSQNGAIASDGTETQLCSTNKQTCNVMCDVWGSNLATAVLSKIDSEGTFTDVAESKDSQNYHKFMIAAVSTEQMTIGESINYQCQVTSFEGVITVRQIKLLPYAKASFDNEETTFIRNTENMTFTCVVTADPLPNITFSIQFGFESRENVQPDHMTIEGNKMVAELTVNIGDDDDHVYASCESDQDLGDIGSWSSEENSWRPTKTSHFYQTFPGP